MPDDQYNSIPMTTPKLLYVIQNGTDFVATSPAGVSETGERAYAIGLSWMKVFFECDDRYRQFLTVKPSYASAIETAVE